MHMNIADTFRDGTVLVTGGTGFLGKLLTEKLLRSCDVKNIAVLVRSKRGLTAEQRISKIYQQNVFDRLRREKPDFSKYIKVISGNIEEPSMELSSTDRDWLIKNVNFVFHCAATIKFNEPLELAAKINIQGTENVLELAAKMKNLKGLVHVSTAYSHCPRYEIREQYYPVPITADELKANFKLQNIPAKILGDWPNTYSFTKAVTENLVSKNCHHLPMSVFRPSIVGCTMSEPDPGWSESMNGPFGLVTGFMIGLLKVILIVKEKKSDIVPADYTVNALISAMWDTVNRHQNAKDEIIEEPKIYNYVSSVEKPLTWGRLIDEIIDHSTRTPPLQSIWYMFCILYTNFWFGLIMGFWFQWIPFAVMDLLLTVSGKNPKMLKMNAKIQSTMYLLHVFTTREWKFDNSNTQDLWLSLSVEEQNTFRFGFGDFDWNSYLKNFYYGIRKHILHEDLSNVPKALAKTRKLFWLHVLYICLSVFIMLKLGWIFIKLF